VWKESCWWSPKRTKQTQEQSDTKTQNIKEKKHLQALSHTQIITVDAPNGRSLSLHLKAVKRLLYMQIS
jgi:hypothetical protein